MMGSPLQQIMALLQRSPMDMLPAQRQDVRPGFGLGSASGVSRFDAGSRPFFDKQDLADMMRGMQAATPMQGKPILRPSGWNALSDEGVSVLESIRRPGHVYRGMEAAEYNATIGAGRGVKSTGAFSHKSEGTNFAQHPADAESYVNFGRSDPRKTGLDTFIVEAKQTPDMAVGSDGYIKAQSEVAPTRVWRIRASDGALVLESLK